MLETDNGDRCVGTVLGDGENPEERQTVTDTEHYRGQFRREFLADVRRETRDERLYRYAWAVYLYLTEEFDRGGGYFLSVEAEQSSRCYARDEMRKHRVYTQLLRSRLGREKVLAVRRSLDGLPHDEIRRVVYDEPTDGEAEWVTVFLYGPHT